MCREFSIEDGIINLAYGESALQVRIILLSSAAVNFFLVAAHRRNFLNFEWWQFPID